MGWIRCRSDYSFSLDDRGDVFISKANRTRNQSITQRIDRLAINSIPNN